MTPVETIQAAPDGVVVLYFGLDGLRDVAAMDKPMELNAVGVSAEDVRGFGRAITCYGARPMGLDGALEIDPAAMPAAADPAPEPAPAPVEEPAAPAADAPAEVSANGDAG